MSVAHLRELRRDPNMLRKATTSTLVSVAATGGDTVKVVKETPAQLAAAAGCALETYSRARMIAAEGYSGAEGGRAAAAVVIGQAVENERKRRKLGSITELLTNSVFSNADGRYGEQRGRYAATTRDPSHWDIEVALAIEAGAVPDLAQGAVHFLAPKLYVGGTQGGRPLGKFETRMRAWILEEGNEPCPPVPTVDPFCQLALRRGGTAASRQRDFERVMDMYNRGVAGDHAPAPGDPDNMTPTAHVVAVFGVAALLAYGAWTWWG